MSPLFHARRRSSPVDEGRRVRGRVQDLLGRALGLVQRRQPRQLVAVLAVEPHDLARRRDLPEVVRGVVAELGQPPVGLRMAPRRRVEVHLRVRQVRVLDQLADLPGPGAGEIAQHALEVADAHVVGDEREVLAAEALAGERQVARRAGQRLRPVEALVDLRAGAPQLDRALIVAAPLGAREPPRDPLARGQVDLHAEQVLRGLGQDLRQPGRRLQAARGAGVRAAGALEEDEALERVGVDLGLGGRALDLRAPACGPLRAGDRTARRERVERMAVAGGGAPLELRGTVGGPRERVGQRRRVGLDLTRRRGHERHAFRRLVAPAREQEDGGRRDDEGGCDRTAHPSQPGTHASVRRDVGSRQV